MMKIKLNHLMVLILVITLNSSERIASDRLILININELSASLIKNNWKLIYHSSLPNKIQLFNLLDDPIEENNIHNKNVEQSSKLMKIIQDLAWDMEDSFFTEKNLLQTTSCFTIIQKGHKFYSVSIF